MHEIPPVSALFQRGNFCKFLLPSNFYVFSYKKWTLEEICLDFRIDSRYKKFKDKPNGSIFGKPPKTPKLDKFNKVTFALAYHL